MHAVVIGGSVAGMCAARVLADYFDRVTVLDRDAYPAGGVERAGVPQARHVHALLVRGRRELDRLFPGFDDLMRARGAHEVDFGWDIAALRPDRWMPRERTGMPTLFASRALLESVVRELLRRHANVELAERTAVRAVIADGGRARGVRLQSGEEVPADLVIDASGRASKAPEWLRALGLPLPEETVVDSFSGYSTRWFQAPDPARLPASWWWKAVWIDPKEPDHMSAAVLFPAEQGRWIVTIAGLCRQYPPADEDGFTAALGRLRTPILAEAVRLAEPISPVYCNRAMANRFRHYERWAARLDAFVAIGDSVCAFNPVYGQGMTTAAIAAGLLGASIDRVGPTNTRLARDFFRAQGRFLRDPWSLATGADFHFPGTEGQRPPFVGLFTRYFDALLTAGTDDAELRLRVGEVINMLRPPGALFDASVLARVGLDAVRRRFAARTMTSAPVPAMPLAS
jgi:2-polyprenyl-6-methoxyphenol hydroxylase-like FAD-dependent oxidoreductase